MQTTPVTKPTGYSPPRETFLDLQQYERDLRLIANTFWLVGGHISQIPRAGDFFAYEFGPDSVIVVRAPNQEVKAFYNVCRHRGSRLCLKAEGATRAFTCAYHAWSYDLDGRLRRAPTMEEGFDPSGLDLIPCPVKVVGGLIFLSFSDSPPELDSYLADFVGELEFHDTARAGVASRSLVSADANWKLLTLNNFECYHCQPAHPTYVRAHPGLGERLLRRDPLAQDYQSGPGVPPEARRPFRPLHGEPDSQFFQYADRMLIGGSAKTESVDGEPVARPMGRATYDGLQSFFVSPVLTIILNPDYSVIYSFVPRGIRRTDIEVIYLFDESSAKDPGFDRRNISAVWSPTLTEDKSLVEANQLGIESKGYRPGPYSALERRLTDFGRWYQSRVPPPAQPEM